jgi:transposase
MRTIELGVTITDAAVDEKTTTIFCAPVARDPRCPDCGHDGRYRDTVTRPLTDLPVAGYPLVLQVAVPRYRCMTAQCGRAVFNQDLGKLAAPRASTTRRCARYVLRRLMIDRTTIAAISAELGVSWHTVSSIAMRAVADLIAATGPDRLTGVKVIGVDEHRWAPRRIGPAGFVTLIIDLTPVHDQSGPARLLDMVQGRSASALASWLATQPAGFAQTVEVIAMDGFAGYKTAATEAIRMRSLRRPALWDPPHRPHPPAAALHPPIRPAEQRIRRRGAHRRQSCLADLPKDHRRLRRPQRRRGKKAMTTLIESLHRGVLTGLEEIAQLGRTLWRRRADILAFFDHHASNGPTEAINGRLEALRRNALGFRNLTHYRLRSLLHSGALHTLVNAL